MGQFSSLGPYWFHFLEFVFKPSSPEIITIPEIPLNPLKFGARLFLEREGGELRERGGGGLLMKQRTASHLSLRHLTFLMRVRESIATVHPFCIRRIHMRILRNIVLVGFALILIGMEISTAKFVNNGKITFPIEVTTKIGLHENVLSIRNNNSSKLSPAPLHPCPAHICYTHNICVF